MKKIALSQGYIALVDDEDHEWLSQWNWFAQRKDNSEHVYAERWDPMQNGYRRRIKMHRTIVGAGFGQIVDHRNRDTLDNRRDNLRLCNVAQSAWNRGKPRDNTTGFVGVFRSRKRYQANVYSNGVRHHCGMWSTPEEAALARDKKALEIFGEFAVLNFPGETI
jgi:HNH endonuclease